MSSFQSDVGTCRKVVGTFVRLEYPNPTVPRGRVEPGQGEVTYYDGFDCLSNPRSVQ